jgi:hypothetical protein
VSNPIIIEKLVLSFEITCTDRIGKHTFSDADGMNFANNVPDDKKLTEFFSILCSPRGIKLKVFYNRYWHLT